VAEPALLYCVGATKAGTSWFYRALADHPDCGLRAVKEAHYWDTFADIDRDKQVAAFRGRLATFIATRDRAAAAGVAWQEANMARQVADLSALIDVVEGDRTGDAAYLAWLLDGAGNKALVADITPSYSLLEMSVLARMAALRPVVRFVYLIRDPLARLWSHVRMQAQRQLQAGETLEKKANATLWRILNRGQETHILARGDYPGTVARLRQTIPAGRLRVEYSERLFTEAGLREMFAFLGIGFSGRMPAGRIHEGPQVALRADLIPVAVKFLKAQYDWAAAEMGPLPRAWQDNLARMAA
jgi:hypothetical protein